VNHGLYSPDVPIFCPVYEVPEDAEDVFQPRKSRKANPAVGKTEPRQSTVDGARPRLDWQLRFPNVKQKWIRVVPPNQNAAAPEISVWLRP
jgi:hypothetical protein